MNGNVLPGGSDFHRQLANSVPFELVLLEETGHIRWSNTAWTRFTDHLTFQDSRLPLVTNYFDTVYAALYDSNAKIHFSNIIEFIRLTDDSVSLNYKIRIRDGRWLHVYLEGLHLEGEKLILASHVDITDQKQREATIRQMADVDGLTGLTNRRGLDTFLQNEFNRAQRIHWPVSLLLIDVDHFKTYNDRYGHLAGDDTLRTIAQVLNRFGRRPTDLVARYGGEEFAIVLGTTHQKGALAMARAVHRAVRGLELPFPEGTDGRVSVSIGVGTMYPKPSSVPAELISLADRALYSAKEDGRDRIAKIVPA